MCVVDVCHVALRLVVFHKRDEFPWLWHFSLLRYLILGHLSESRTFFNWWRVQLPLAVLLALALILESAHIFVTVGLGCKWQGRRGVLLANVHKSGAVLRRCPELLQAPRLGFILAETALVEVPNLIE